MNLRFILISLGVVASPLVAAASSQSMGDFPELKRDDGSVISYYFQTAPQASANNK